MARSRNNTLEFSSAGSTIIDSAAGATAGSFGAIQFLKDSTISAVTSSTVDNSAKLLTTLAAGTIVYGQFSSVTISAGLVALHKV
ncbi:MAG: hypothetical protein ACW99G_22780 [Candidatus Thorarchaeota archaeon]|jgi:hypothetical protein